MTPSPAVTFRGKYRSVGHWLALERGRLLDVGARDRVLKKYLPETIEYHSLDTGPGHNVQANLEGPLPLDNQSYDGVVALDVLEHVDNIHGAFHELARISRGFLVVGLPNVASFPRRVLFLLRGSLGSHKYDLTSRPLSDRHRWLTVYPQIQTFVRENAAAAGFETAQVWDEVEGGSKLSRLFCYVLAKSRLFPCGWWIGRTLFLLRRKETFHSPPGA